MKKFLHYFIILYSSFYIHHSFAQTPKIDSLLSVLHALPSPNGEGSGVRFDTTRINTLNALSRELRILGNYEKALQHANEALTLANSLSFGEGFRERSLAKAYNNIGNIYKNQGNYAQALKNHFASLKIDEELGDKKGIAASYGNIGNIYYYQGNYERALENHFSSQKIFEEIGDKKGIAASYNNIGNIYKNQGNYDKALENFFASMKIDEELGDKKGIAGSNNNIGLIYKEQGNYDNALENNFASMKIFEEIGDKQGIAMSYNNIGIIYLRQNKITEAKKQSLASLKIAVEIGSKDDIKSAYDLLSRCDSASDNWKGAYEYHKLFSAVKDSIFNEESSNQIAEMQTKYETEKKEQQIKLLNVENEKQVAVAAAESKKQRIVIYSVSGGLLLMLLLASVIFKALQNNRKKNKIITHQKLLVEEKQKEITDSITYALRIQRAILPHRSEIWKALPESFVLYKPKDIVAGDFYWFHSPSPLGRAGEGLVLIAAADCTGHGVPGAFTSMICSEKLNDAVKYSNNPGELLSVVNKGIKVSLRQAESNESTKDGMDIALCALELPSPNGERQGMRLKYAGANRPIWIIRNGQTTIEEIKATKKAIGGFTEDEQIFETHTIQLQQGDTFYISTDGYADQDGGEKGKKLMTKTFKQMLLDIQDKSMKVQKEYLENFIENWRADRHQLDDILVIGVRV